MGEILCGVVTGSESSGNACEPTSRSGRRRRMEIRRFRIVSGVAPLPEPGRKRQRLDCPDAVSANLPLDLNTVAADERSEDGAVEASESDSDTSVAVVLNPPPPSPTKEVKASTDLCPGYGMISVCGRRREMEDAVSIRPTFLGGSRRAPGLHFFGVFDGHGCSHVAASCKDRMHEVVAEELESAHGSGTPAVPEWKDVMERSFSRMDGEVLSSGTSQRMVNCSCELHISNCDHVGSTAVVAVVSPDHVVVANCGDSRAVLCRGGAPIPLSTDHKPDRPDELQRIEAAGGRVIYWDGARVLGVLAMSRAIGDNHLKPYVIPEPEVKVTERTDADECLILASDGLWDVVSNATACDVARMCLRGSMPAGGAGGVEVAEQERDKQGGSDKACLDAAILLTKLALARRTSDNVSVVVVDLRRGRNSSPNSNSPRS